MLTAFQPPRKRPSPGQKMTSGGRSLKPAPCPCPIPPAGKGYGRRQHHFLAGKMQRRSDLTLLCCLLQTTVIAACALSSICRSFPPFQEMFIAEVFKGIFRFLSVRPQNLQLCCRLPICPVLLLPEQTSSGFLKLLDSPSSSSVTVRCKYEYA